MHSGVIDALLRRRLRRHAQDVVEHLPLTGDLRAGPSFELYVSMTHLDHIPAPLDFQVAIELLEAERQLQLLPLLALLYQMGHPLPTYACPSHVRRVYR